MDTDTRFECNDQTLWNDLYGNLPANRRRQFTFNRIRPLINMVSGYQRKNRKSTIVIPVENGDQETADQFTKILMWHHTQDNTLETISRAFHGALVTGMNLLHPWVDYRQDPISGNLRIDCLSYNEFLIDPYFKKPDLSDCTGISIRKYVTKREAISLMPERADEILALHSMDSGNGRDGKYQFQPESYNYGVNTKLTYDEFWYRDYRSAKMLVDTQSGMTYEWKSADTSRLKEFIRLNPQVTVVEQEIPTSKVAIIIQGKVFYDGPNPMGIDQFPFVPVFGYYNPQLPYFPWRIQGMVRGLRDAQYLYNRRLITIADIMESQPNSGWIYKENALVNPKDVWTRVGQGQGIAIKAEAQMTDVQQIQAPNVSASLFQLAEIFGKEPLVISGVNEELMGSAVDDKAGILSMLRQGAGLTSLQILFDNLDLAQKLLGRIEVDLIQTNFTPGKVQQVLEGQQPSQEFYNKNFGKYHCKVEEGLNTSTQQQMQFAQMLQLREAGVPITDVDLLEAATLQNKTKIIENMQAQQQQAQQMQQMQMQAQIQEQQARTELAQARSMADKGLGLERISRIEENKALADERRAESVKDEQIALLNLVKALKEIDQIDLNQIEKLITLSSMVKAQETPQAPAPSALEGLQQTESSPALNGLMSS